MHPYDYFALDYTIHFAIPCDYSEPVPVFSSWFLPSENEMDMINANLIAEGIGGFVADLYWTSSEQSNTNAYHNGGFANKVSLHRVRAVRTFTFPSSFHEWGDYPIGGIGPGGGYIFYITGRTFYEAYPTDQSAGCAWSNITNILAGTSLVIGSGLNNTLLIIAQTGHTASAAKLCHEL
jgi:hypothetical protein